MGAGEPQGNHDDDHWRARRLRKRVDDRRQREREVLLEVQNDEEKKQARDAASLRALQVGLSVD